MWQDIPVKININLNTKKIYFNNVLDYGDLYFDCSLVEDDFPILFIVKNKKDERFICACFEIKNQQSWVLNKINVQEIEELLTNLIDIRQAFLLDNDNGRKLIISEKKDDQKVKIVDKNYLINKNIILDEGDYLEAEENEFSDYLNLINQLQRITLINIEKEVYLNFDGLLIPLDKIGRLEKEEEKSKFLKNEYKYKIYIRYFNSNTRLLIFESTNKKEFEAIVDKVNEILNNSNIG